MPRQLAGRCRVRGLRVVGFAEVPIEGGEGVGSLLSPGNSTTARRRKDLPDVGDELADVFLCLTAPAEMNRIGLDHEVNEKIDENGRRVYRTNKDGVPKRVAEG
ncbi:hypothetical protein [Streptomyces iconiensis]|uniref:Uncharacterized protein n=1 Tax=Streptomyces iconiensis TaxID=1384038 RepID=A0ABT7A3A7_9ACTN|nr:hypothetical protein [Streptomyces iconiensis]MDJ1135814.1 hypothetical protein [Streptomyces iconiensis]